MRPAQINAINVTGSRFGKLVVTRFHSVTADNRTQVVCRCDCGLDLTVLLQSVKSGNTKSCGCLVLETNTIHGMCYSPTYSTWLGMLRRCTDPKNNRYKHYGGRGINVVAEWENFEIFYAEMGDRPVGMSIDRIDVNGNYEKSNCRWATPTEQSNNRRIHAQSN